MSRTSLALGNLRGIVILIVLGFHSVLAYLDFLPATAQKFDTPPYQWVASPIIDSQRWLGFDLFCAWHDVYLMALMYFLSGLFVWGSLTRKGVRLFLSDRLLRLGLPLIPAVFVLMPIALYPASIRRPPGSVASRAAASGLRLDADRPLSGLSRDRE